MRALLFGTASVLALTLGACAVLRAPRPATTAASSPAPADTRRITRHFLMYFIVPLWLGAGVADWLCHRASRIEQTTGAKETLIHLLMLAEMGVPTLAGLLFEINAPVLAVMIAAFFAHEGTALWDVGYAVTRREVTPVEQHVHSFLEMLPLMAVGFVSVLHWPKLRALAGLDIEVEPRLRLKREGLPKAYLAGDLAALVLLEALPYFEELWRDWRANPGRLVPPAALSPSA